MTPRLEIKHRRATRWFHWLNFPLLALMIWSGILIYWANGIYHVGWDDHTIIRMFPAFFYETFGIDHRLAEGIAWHFFLQWFFVLNGLGYVVYTFVSGEWREMVPNRHSPRDAWEVVLHELHLRDEKPPQRKYNGAQRILYSLIILCGVGSVLTGYAIYKPVQLGWLRMALGGYESAHFIHFWLAMGYVAFFVVHIIQVARAGWSNFVSMVTGYESK
jgi:thiosulfate reductase cytochrome b subunit